MVENIDSSILFQARSAVQQITGLPSNKTPLPVKDEKKDPKVTSNQKFEGERHTVREGENTYVYHQDTTAKNTHSRLNYIGEVISIDNLYTGDRAIYFDHAQKNLTPDDYKTVTNIVDFLKANPDTNISIEGYTDTTGPDTYNKIWG
ncbi:MAG: OmpA family protein [Rickettsiales bacterium]|nr:OmpA family protein [Rickettsiales bacterium]